MNKALLGTTAAILMVMAGSANAQQWSSEIDAGLFSSVRTSTDTDIVGSPFTGTFLSGYADYTTGQFRFAIDGRVETIDDEGLDDVYESGPVQAGVIGLHGGLNYGPTYLGAFVAAGYFDGADSDKSMNGQIVGLEAEHALPSGLSIFGQLGYAKAIGNDGDNEFKGPSAKFGLAGRFSEKVGFETAFEAARSAACFEDCGTDQWGLYTALSFEVSYDFSDRISVFGAIKHANIEANTEDSGRATNLYVGLRVPLGAKPKSRLRTPMGAFEAAGWMEPLD